MCNRGSFVCVTPRDGVRSSLMKSRRAYSRAVDHRQFSHSTEQFVTQSNNFQISYSMNTISRCFLTRNWRDLEIARQLAITHLRRLCLYMENTIDSRRYIMNYQLYQIIITYTETACMIPYILLRWCYIGLEWKYV